MKRSTGKGLINNRRVKISIRTKLLLIYFLCVLVPILIFSYIFYSSAMENIKKEKLIIFDQTLDRIASSIESGALSAISLSNAIYPDSKMYHYINTEYASKGQALEDYNSYLRDAWLRILPYNTDIVLFTVYTDNNTILNSRNLRRIDSIATEVEWYERYSETDDQDIFINHVDKLLLSSSRAKLISYFRRLDYSKSEYNHFLKVTFKADMLDKIIGNELLPGNIYIVNDQDLIATQSNKSESTYSNKSFVPFSAVEVEEGQITLEQQINVPSGWRVICILDKDFMLPDFRSSIRQISVLIIFVALLASLIILMIAGSIYRRIYILSEHMGRAEDGDYNQIPERKKGNDELGLLMTSMNKMLAKIRSLIEDVYKAKIRETQLELLKNQAELKALQCQVNPHFMFNVLETIRIKSYLKNEYETARIIRNMSFVFRKLLMWSEDMIEVREEINFIKEYLEIQQYRYEDELEYEIDVDESVLDVKIPKMTLQTFVDNSCEHGFSETNGIKKLRIEAVSEEDRVVLIIWDNGKGMTDKEIKDIGKLSGRGIGIKNVIGRLDLYLGDNYDFKINSSPGQYTEIVLTINLGKGGVVGYVQDIDS